MTLTSGIKDELNISVSAFKCSKIQSEPSFHPNSSGKIRMMLFQVSFWKYN